MKFENRGLRLKGEKMKELQAGKRSCCLGFFHRGREPPRSQQLFRRFLCLCAPAEIDSHIMYACDVEHDKIIVGACDWIDAWVPYFMPELDSEA